MWLRSLRQYGSVSKIAARRQGGQGARMTGILRGIAIKAVKRAPMEVLDRASVTVAGGVDGDFRGKMRGRKVTVLFAEDWARAVAGLDPEAAWTVRRANLLVAGVANRRRAGGVLAVGAARLKITGETTPCVRMDEQLPGLQAALAPDWLGGLTAMVAEGGDIAVEDAVWWID
jgi:MOSC domain-containing protein YiiM